MKKKKHKKQLRELEQKKSVIDEYNERYFFDNNDVFEIKRADWGRGELELRFKNRIRASG
jgi:hypothetical protein